MDEMDKPLVLRILADEVRRWVDDEVDISLLLDGIRIGVVAMVGLRAASFSDAGVDGASDADAADDALFRRHLSNFCHGLACSLPVLVPASDWAAVVVELVAGRILLCKKKRLCECERQHLWPGLDGMVWRAEGATKVCCAVAARSNRPIVPMVQYTSLSFEFVASPNKKENLKGVPPFFYSLRWWNKARERKR
jgi:hypothetical protein